MIVFHKYLTLLPPFSEVKTTHSSVFREISGLLSPRLGPMKRLSHSIGHRASREAVNWLDIQSHGIILATLKGLSSHKSGVFGEFDHILVNHATPLASNQVIDPNL